MRHQNCAFVETLLTTMTKPKKPAYLTHPHKIVIFQNHFFLLVRNVQVDFKINKGVAYTAGVENIPMIIQINALKIVRIIVFYAQINKNVSNLMINFHVTLAVNCVRSLIHQKAAACVAQQLENLIIQIVLATVNMGMRKSIKLTVLRFNSLIASSFQHLRKLLKTFLITCNQFKF
ncbi:hypothetical protein TTHERM_000300369 (macronuclear) [Tetrahymena thermophila SB210]|uniref:Uncharacterized protein n=1 Tax=Tetrahymena thermophila (strain SB210) TaxID=312017 RepID=W7WYC9_TETTS|nr:hypothetical protein TTHERM_000300369 [Tetrahymena thermophila SB210]EWS71865.1 hypothetical protein TTHERM_000300369 [Tetrahymena thermophila SB210]|eukprot:XP_012655609.1 hypothetical protein TTHERM_000300369 [Tetrahymena thermophila SB210]